MGLFLVVDTLKSTVLSLLNRVNDLENKCGTSCKPSPSCQMNLKNVPAVKKEEDDVDLFGSDSEDEDDQANKVREERLAAYAAKKSKSKRFF